MLVIGRKGKAMELVLQKDLKHQEDGVKAVNDVFEKVYIQNPDIFYSNPIINLEDEQIYENIKKIKNNNSIDDKNITRNKDYLSIDVKMETGTGKTYVYTKTIFELNKNYGFNKFIILVPSLAIKAGTAQFIFDGYVKRHFRDVCDYKKEINLGVLSSIKNKNKKKKSRKLNGNLDFCTYVLFFFDFSRKIYWKLADIEYDKL